MLSENLPLRIESRHIVPMQRGIFGVKKGNLRSNRPLFPLPGRLCSIGTIIALAVLKADYEYLAEC